MPMTSVGVASSSSSNSSSSSSSSSSSNSNIPTSSGECDKLEKLEISKSQEEQLNYNISTTTINTAVSTTRKKRKQEFRIKTNDEPAVNNSNNPFYPNRYLNENTNISNSNNNINKKSKSINKIYKNDLKNGEYFIIDETTVSSLEEDEPNSKQPRLVHADLNSKSKSLNPNNKKKINLNQIESNNNNNNNNNIDTKEEFNLVNNENTNNSDQIEVEQDEVEQEQEEDITCLDDETVERLSKEFSYVASNGVKWVSKKQSNISFSKAWNPLKHHFVNYSDIKLDSEHDSVFKSNTSNKLTHKQLLENLNDWKFHFVISQVENLVIIFFLSI
jgi:hypothetical protein